MINSRSISIEVRTWQRHKSYDVTKLHSIDRQIMDNYIYKKHQYINNNY